MQANPRRNWSARAACAESRLKQRGGKWTLGLTLLVAAAVWTGTAQEGQKQAQAGNGPPSQEAASHPSANAGSQGATPQKASRKEKAEAAEAARKQQLADDSARLLALAIALKAEVDKTSKDTLSLTVIRKADEIEKLAHTVRETIKQTAGAS